MALLETYALVNTYIVFKNKIGDEGKKLKARKYSQKQLRLQLVKHWMRKCIKTHAIHKNVGKKKKKT